MNRIIYNYKTHVERVVDGRTFAGLIDMGWYHWQRLHLQLSGLTLPDPRKAKGAERQRLFDMHERAAACLSTALMYPDGKSEHGRTVVISPHEPNRYARALVDVYVPCRHLSIERPAMTRRAAGYVLLDVVKFLYHLGESGFDATEAAQIVADLELYDFDK